MCASWYVFSAQFRREMQLVLLFSKSLNINNMHTANHMEEVSVLSTLLNEALHRAYIAMACLPKKLLSDKGARLLNELIKEFEDWETTINSCFPIESSFLGENIREE